MVISQNFNDMACNLTVLVHFTKSYVSQLHALLAFDVETRQWPHRLTRYFTQSTAEWINPFVETIQFPHIFEPADSNL